MHFIIDVEWIILICLPKKICHYLDISQGFLGPLPAFSTFPRSGPCACRWPCIRSRCTSSPGWHKHVHTNSQNQDSALDFHNRSQFVLCFHCKVGECKITHVPRESGELGYVMAQEQATSDSAWLFWNEWPHLQYGMNLILTCISFWVCMCIHIPTKNICMFISVCVCPSTVCISLSLSIYLYISIYTSLTLVIKKLKFINISKKYKIKTIEFFFFRHNSFYRTNQRRSGKRDGFLCKVTTSFPDGELLRRQRLSGNFLLQPRHLPARWQIRPRRVSNSVASRCEKTYAQTV